LIPERHLPLFCRFFNGVIGEINRRWCLDTIIIIIVTIGRISNGIIMVLDDAKQNRQNRYAPTTTATWKSHTDEDTTTTNRRP
jgi:hypothetical protein